MRGMLLVSLVLFVLVATGCADDDTQVMIGPVVYLELDTAAWTPNELDWIEKGSREWRKLGYDVRPIGEPVDPSLTLLPESVRDYQPDMTTAIVIRIHHDPSLADDGVYGLSSTNTRDVLLNPVLTTLGVDGRLFDLYGSTAHELGHQLLHSGHMPKGGLGVMASPRSAWSLTEADLAFAFAETGRQPVD